MQYWKAHYKDVLHDTDIEILNTEEDYNTDPLSFVLDDSSFPEPKKNLKTVLTKV